MNIIIKTKNALQEQLLKAQLQQEGYEVLSEAESKDEAVKPKVSATDLAVQEACKILKKGITWTDGEDVFLILTGTGCTKINTKEYMNFIFKDKAKVIVGISTKSIKWASLKKSGLTAQAIVTALS